MARIIRLQTKITFQQHTNEWGNYYPACIFSNETFLSHYENSLLISKQLLDPNTDSWETISGLLTSLSEYKVWKYEKEKANVLESEINEHFTLLPDKECNIEMLFQPYNNVPTDAILYSYDEVAIIVKAMANALEKADAEQSEVINPIYNGFNSFLIDWNENQAKTGSYFANEIQI